MLKNVLAPNYAKKPFLLHFTALTSILAPYSAKTGQIYHDLSYLNHLVHIWCQKRILAPYGLKIMQIVRNAFLLHFTALTSKFWHHMVLKYVWAP